jgi:hypothetical protein
MHGLCLTANKEKRNQHHGGSQRGRHTRARGSRRAAGKLGRFETATDPAPVEMIKPLIELDALRGSNRPEARTAESHRR